MSPCLFNLCAEYIMQNEGDLILSLVIWGEYFLNDRKWLLSFQSCHEAEGNIRKDILKSELWDLKHPY